jgi:Peptidase A4 family
MALPCSRLLRALLAASLLTGAAAGSGAARPPLPTRVSPSWSGYVATAHAGHRLSFRQVTGTWRVPAVHCGRRQAGALAAIWVGLGGYLPSEPKLEQIGTDAGCSSAGRRRYDAWFEVVPYPAYPLPGRISAGDVVSASVRLVAGSVELELANRTLGWKATRTIAWPLPATRSAEWVVEAPGSCKRFFCVEAPLADFGRLTFLHAAAGTSTGVAGVLADDAWRLTALRLVPGHLTGTLGLEEPGSETAAEKAAAAPAGATGTPAGATPGPLSAEGRGFAISWIADATATAAARSGA